MSEYCLTKQVAITIKLFATMMVDDDIRIDSLWSGSTLLESSNSLYQIGRLLAPEALNI